MESRYFVEIGTFKTLPVFFQNTCNKEQINYRAQVFFLILKEGMDIILFFDCIFFVHQKINEATLFYLKWHIWQLSAECIFFPLSHNVGMDEKHADE